MKWAAKVQSRVIIYIGQHTVLNTALMSALSRLLNKKINLCETGRRTYDARPHNFYPYYVKQADPGRDPSLTRTRVTSE